MILSSERGRYVLPKESPAQVYLAQADFEMRIGGLATAKNLLNKVSIIVESFNLLVIIDEEG